MTDTVVMIINNSLSPSIPEFLIKIEEIMRSKFLFFYSEKDAHIAHACMNWCLQIENLEIDIICPKFAAAQNVDLTNVSKFNVNIHQTDVNECIHIANVEQLLQMLCDCSSHQISCWEVHSKCEKSDWIQACDCDEKLKL